MRKPDLSAAFGLVIFIMLIVVATAAYIAYKKPDTTAIILWGSVGVVALFILGLFFFGGVKMPGTKSVRLAPAPVTIVPKPT